MVLSQRVGKPRSFLRGLVLTVFTFGLYGIYWIYKAHNELYRQFELDREHRDEGVIWLVLGFVVPFLRFVYDWKVVANLNYIRERLRMPRGITPGGFIGLQVASIAVTWVILFAVVFPAMAGLETGADGSVDEDQVEAAVGTLVSGALLSFVAGLGVVLFAFYKLQTSMNETWQAYDARMHELTAPRGPPAEPPAAEPPA